MRKDWVDWGLCILLFFSGVVFSKFCTDSDFLAFLRDFDSSQWIAAFSSLATAAAAIAAWKAADTSKSQANASAQQSRWQMYRMHCESFVTLLEDIESDYQVRFYRKTELYDAVFPCNRDVRKEFSSEAGPELHAWLSEVKKLSDFCCDQRAKSPGEVADFFLRYGQLCGYMKYTMPVVGPQIYLDGKLPTGICRDNFKKVIPALSDALKSISVFSFVEYEHSWRGMEASIAIEIRSFINKVSSGLMSEHSYKE